MIKSTRTAIEMIYCRPAIVELKSPGYLRLIRTQIVSSKKQK